MNYCFHGAQWLIITQSEGSTRLLLCIKTKTEPTSKTCFFKKLDTKFPPKFKIVYIDFICAVCSLSWIFWLFKIGPISCPQTLVMNYHSVLCNVPEECISRINIWLCRPWFGSEWTGLTWSDSVHHMQIQDDLIYLDAKFKDKAHLAFK